MKLRSILPLALILIFSFSACGQKDKSKRPSPPKVAEGMIGSANVKVDYSSPSVKDRTVWGELVKYNKVWRTGANESTWIETDKDLMVEGKKLPAGKYGLFTIPGEKEWVVIFNNVWDKWGAYSYKESEDVLRITVIPGTTKHTEMMTFEVVPDGIILSWEKLMLKVNMN